jgi:hypothetical protein
MLMRSDFSQMSLANRALLLWTDGTLLCKSRKRGVATSLYLLDNLFVEVFYEKTSGLISDIQALTHCQEVDYVPQLAAKGGFA